MIKFLLSLSFLMVAGCATASAGKTDGLKRLPSGSSSLPIAIPLIKGAYQGPIDINPQGATRLAAKVYLPLQYDTKDKWPLVILLHGFSGTAEDEDSYLTLRYRVSSKGFILLTPQGTAVPKGTIIPDGSDISGYPFWNATDYCCDFGKTNVDDVGYLRQLIAKVKADYHVDSSRVYLFGHSNGGFMANRLACEFGEELAGIASLAGGAYKSPAQCRNPKPIPFLQIHAVNDDTIVYGGTPQYAGGQDTIQQWVSRNGCAGPGKTGAPKDFLFMIPGPDTSERVWNKCASGKDVVFWTIKKFETQGHNPHVPLFNLNFSDAVLNFLLSHRSLH